MIFSKNLAAFRASSPLLRISSTAAVAALLLSASVFVWNRLPNAATTQGAFDVHGTMGSSVTGRLFSATVTKVGIAPIVKHTGFSPRQRNIKSVGQWVVVKLTITSMTEASQADAILALGDKGYTPDSRLEGSTLLGAQLTPLIPESGVFVFEVSSNVLERTRSAKLYIFYAAGQYKWDSRLVIDIPLDTEHAPRTSVIALPKTLVGKQ
ncbi:hypothetical protein [Mycobacteroides franklinii]|uniref:DUF4352 domain-containing protein n=1 Tax=Mycobacteroides franklinii TaxID=948102 RepID=A0A4R8QXZ6_9MYCO|nr:hypothetical protein [Mycobacteroides franklinii]TDZ45250.1 hypothetical protein CCUG64054_00894 [Mycobacteroides franklinii]TDZ48741.1 hypothetical protein CCUG63697_03271 [Mycobacteroides franklinii]TDZ58922.1 hypothetical protein CCUG63696_00898 [Mycobacteroides franklinii]TDZ66436.1 hypothetical protein CCUG63695_00260 [Mycobacteroides franklinii]TDZ72359.1 hypothetical protein CCUG64056_00894 [Mycobacteroides franklinii]